MKHALTIYPVGRIDILRIAIKLLGIRKRDRVVIFESDGKMYLTKEDFTKLPEGILYTAYRSRELAPSNQVAPLSNLRTTMKNTLPLKYKMEGKCAFRKLLRAEKYNIDGADDPEIVCGVEALELLV
jgi:hypothetical protein